MRFNFLKHLFSSFFFFFFSTVMSAQTCCSGGVPVSSNLGLPLGKEKSLQFSLGYDLNHLNTLKNEANKLDNPGSKRQTQTLMFQTGYAINKRLSIDAFIPFVRQERTSDSGIFEHSQNLGDLALLLKLKAFANLNDQSYLIAAIGVEFPTGKYDQISKVSGITLGADMQPGSGSYDLIGWTRFVHNLDFRPSMNFISQGILKINGQNDNFRNGLLTYQFGNEFQILAGFSDQVLVGKLLIDPSISVKYRQSFSDKNDASGDLTELPATGGQFLFINPALTYQFSPTFSIHFQFELPLYVKVTETQIAPTYRFGFNLLYQLKLKGQN